MFQEKIPLHSYSTFGIGGPARYFATVKTQEELQRVFERCRRESLPFFVLGKGSNCLFDDKGFDGVVILNKIDFLEASNPGSFFVGSGYSFSRLGALTARKGWEGLEFASGIPGTVGGALFMNAGANGNETCDTLKYATYLTLDGEVRTYNRAELAFSYRASPFQKMQGAILNATFHLKASNEAKKKQLKILNYRKSTQPYSEKSAGCIFRNPEQDFAGALIEQCGLKGFTVGGAAISLLHANFIVNIGKATSSDVRHLIEHVQQKVKEKTGKSLLSEVRTIPYQPEAS